MEAHNAATAAIAARVREFHEKQKPFRIYHGSTNSTRRSERRRDNIVDTSTLDHVLHVSGATKTAVVEPNVPMDALVEATLRHGLVPQVVMEFPGITVGGGFSGTSGESSSFKFGLFEVTVHSIEIVLASGDIVRASKCEKPDLFWGAASAFGTLGVVTLLEVQLIDAKSFVELTYHLPSSVADANSRIQEETASGTANDFVDAVIFSPDATIVCAGRLVDSLPEGSVPRRFTRSRDPWFYIRLRNLQTELRKNPGRTATDYIPLADYLFRWDRGGFWTAQYGFRYFLTPFNRITRFVLDPFIHTRVMYQAMHKSGLSNFSIVQDVSVPYNKVEEFYFWLHENLNIYPLWLCPLRLARSSPDASHGIHAGYADPATPNMLNFGVWGAITSDRRETIRQNRLLEQKVQELGGEKCLYAHTYYTEDEFWAHYDRKSYDALRAKYGATYLPSIYDKVNVDVDAEEAAIRSSWTLRLRARVGSVWPLRGLYGAYKALMGGDYLLPRRSLEKIMAKDS